MSEFVRHEECPKCLSKDNLAVFDDGHKWCFGCGYYETGIPSIESVRKKFDNRKIENITFLPKDFSFDISYQGRDWLRKYKLTQKDIINHRFGWSNGGIFLNKTQKQVAPLLVFPIYDNFGTLLMWQGRNFGEEGPKYITRGAKDVLHILGDTDRSDVIIFTEDLISAIKVSHLAPSMPLWGSFLSPEMARRVAARFSKGVLWLDKDKAKEASKMAANLFHVFEEGISCIRSERDPKEYLQHELQEYLK